MDRRYSLGVKRMIARSSRISVSTFANLKSKFFSFKLYIYLYELLHFGTALSYYLFIKLFINWLPVFRSFHIPIIVDRNSK